MKFFVPRVTACSRTRLPASPLKFWKGVNRPRLYSQKSESDESLRILFCGTDSFSKESLEALHDFSKTPDSNIASIDVVTKTDKRVGRGRTILQSPAIKAAAQERALPIHQIDSFTGWQPPVSDKNEHCNLVVAVSFGLLIPPRILGTAKYGGLNIHPSMLPDLRGPGPVEWAIILGRRTTGISLQTLHPTQFDEGMILDQTPHPGWEIPDPDTITSKQLESHLAPMGAKMLVDAIKNRLYIPPLNPYKFEQGLSKEDLVHAPKITKEFRRVDFGKMTRLEVLRRSRACAPLHAFATRPEYPHEKILVKFDETLRAVEDGDIPEEARAAAKALPRAYPYAIIRAGAKIGESQQPLIVNAKGEESNINRQVVIPMLTVAGMAKLPGAKAAAQARLFSQPQLIGDYELFPFSHRLVGEHSPV